MKEIIKDLKLSGLTFKQKAIVWYFSISLCSLCITDESPIWAVIIVVLNFANSARLVKKVPIPEDNSDTI